MGYVMLLLALTTSALVACAWLLGTTHAPPAPPAGRYPAQRPRQTPGPRVELPAGEAGHLMAAEALHRATGMYLRECEDRAGP
jgi:hypothetical protein